MDCPNCSTPHPDAARFCARCGTPLDAATDRSGQFAAHPEEPVRALAVMSTLMPHLSGGRHHVYRGVIALALLAALIAAAFGMLAVALMLTAIALPAAVLTYVHDHDVWHDEPITVIGVAFLLSLALGAGVGLLERDFTKPVLLAAPDHRLPPLTQILELGVLVPVVGFVAVLIAPTLMTARSAFRHPVDAVVICALSGAALSLGLSVVVQRGAFAHIEATAGDPTHIAFIAFTLGFLQPIIFATAAAMAVVALHSAGVNTALGLVKGLVLMVLYELATTLLTPYGTRGIVLTTLTALVLAAAGLLGTRDALHTSLLAEAEAALTGGALKRAPDAHQICAHCGAAIGANAAFCQACGTATAALVRHPAVALEQHGPPPLHYPGGGARVGHRLRPAVVAAIIAVIILIAALVTALIVFSGTTSPPKRSPLLPGSHAAATAAPAARGMAVMLTSADPIGIGQGISITPAPGWRLTGRGPNSVTLSAPDDTAQMQVAVKTAGSADVVTVLHSDINQVIATSGLTNVSVVGTPATRSLPSHNFQQAASTYYSADFSVQMGTTHLLGEFMELLNPSTRLSAFIDYRQLPDATSQPGGAGEMMISSML